MQQCFIVDIDGTLADGTHRQHFVRGKPKNWDAYDAIMHKDTPIQPVIDIINIIYSCGIDIIVCSGRKERDRKITEAWFKEHGIDYTKMYFRPTLDYSDDCVVKEAMLKEIQKDYSVIAVFDDRTKVVNMWRKNGLYVFDCNRAREIF